MKLWIKLLIALLMVARCGSAHAQSDKAARAGKSVEVEASRGRSDTPIDVLSADEWRRVDASVQRALTWLAGQQQPDGSFPTIEMGQPGVTSLCMMAFMAHGHVPGAGPFGGCLDRATDFVLASQKENGLLSRVGPDGPQISRAIVHEIGEAAAYNHAIASLTLSELYGLNQSQKSEQIKKVIEKSLATTLEMQRWIKIPAEDRGGWRYVGTPANGRDSDLSVTGWELMFLRSARNDGFNVPKKSIDDAVAYIRRCYMKDRGTFVYMLNNGNSDLRSRAMAGAGVLALAHAGLHGTPEAKNAAIWLQQFSFADYNHVEPFGRPTFPIDRYHYSLFNSCQAMYQMGGRHWEKFFPPTVRALLANQQPDGSWPAESHMNDAQFGNAYTTALVILSLGAPNQFLPIFQR
jgi:prenyltransferase/squalene oxidase-like repeat protein